MGTNDPHTKADVFSSTATFSGCSSTKPTKKASPSIPVNTAKPPTASLPSISNIFDQEQLWHQEHDVLSSRNYRRYPSFTAVTSSDRFHSRPFTLSSPIKTTAQLVQYSDENRSEAIRSSPGVILASETEGDLLEHSKLPETGTQEPTYSNKHQPSLLPEIKSRSKTKINGAHTFQSTQNKELRKAHPKVEKISKKWSKEDDAIIIHQKEVLKRSWKDIEAQLNRKHSWQAIQMRYLRCHKTRNKSWTYSDTEKLKIKIKDDFKNRFKRVADEMGPSFDIKSITAKIKSLSETSNDPILAFYSEEASEHNNTSIAGLKGEEP